MDCLDFDGLDVVFNKYKGIKVIIYFVVSKVVGEFVEKLLFYYCNNFVFLINLFELMFKYGIEGIVFFFLCIVYGELDELFVIENVLIKKVIFFYGNIK